MPPVRAFIAIASSRALLDALARLQSELRAGPGGGAGRWVAPENAHLTLKFLGDVPAERTAAIARALEATCAAQAPFTLTLQGLGCFPNTRRPRVVWVGVREERGALQALHSQIEQALAALGYPAEGRAFTPHLTLARVREGAAAGEVEALGRSVVERQPTAELPLAQMLVREVILFRSDLRPEGPRYTPLQRAALQGQELG